MGFTYSYACAVPKLVKDRIATCGTTLQDCFNDADTFYRLPFVIGFPIWSIGQGNCGEFTHSGFSQYAYDFGAPAGTPIRAARGGVVVFVEEDNYLNCCPLGTGDSCFDPCPFDANSVIIEHQDGTVGIYVHMPQNGVSVDVGDRVRRGDPIAVVGNTGFSTGPHLHFIVRKAIGDNGLPSRFQVVGQDCFRPDRGDLLLSNNKAWYE
jgi:murein DD-endopeptidase MepM/ murein hydrolase activator NlpD